MPPMPERGPRRRANSRTHHTGAKPPGNEPHRVARTGPGVTGAPLRPPRDHSWTSVLKPTERPPGTVRGPHARGRSPLRRDTDVRNEHGPRHRAPAEPGPPDTRPEWPTKKPRNTGRPAKTRRPPPGGRAGVATRSGSGGVEPVPFSERSLLAKLNRKTGHRQQERIPSFPSVCRFDICCPITVRCVERRSISRSLQGTVPMTYSDIHHLCHSVNTDREFRSVAAECASVLNAA
jgi:hypothetical protein